MNMSTEFMNDLINELAVQAGAELYGSKEYTNIIVNDRDADALMRKFAELVAEATLKAERERRGDDEYDE